MTIESATYIDDLDAANPGATDNISEGDDHLRLIKTVIKASFPNITGAVTVTQSELNALSGITASVAELNILDNVTATTAEINYVDGVTSAIQTQLNAKATGNPTVEAKTDNFTAASSYIYVLRTASSKTATLKSSPSAKDEITLVNTSGGSWTVARNSSNIMGSAANDTIVDGATHQYIYIDSTTGWARIKGA
jgi:hypothetical protein